MIYINKNQQVRNLKNVLRCLHLVPAVNASATRASNTTAHPIAIQFPGHGCTDYSTGLLNKHHPWVSVQPSTVRLTGAEIICLCCMPGLPTHLVQKLYVCTVLQ